MTQDERDQANLKVAQATFARQCMVREGLINTDPKKEFISTETLDKIVMFISGVAVGAWIVVLIYKLAL